jgi:hypothetical protein
VTWNSASLFGAFATTPGRSDAKRRLATKLFDCHKIAFFQETRGTAGDLASLPPSHLHFGSFLLPDEVAGTSRSGGVVTSVRLDVADMIQTFSERCFANGRCHGLHSLDVSAA